MEQNIQTISEPRFDVEKVRERTAKRRQILDQIEANKPNQDRKAQEIMECFRQIRLLARTLK